MESETAMKPVGLGDKRCYKRNRGSLRCCGKTNCWDLRSKPSRKAKSSKFDAQPLRYQAGGERSA